MKHYIIVEVREREFKGRLNSDTSMVRKALHDYCEEKGINAADAVIKEGREWLHPLVNAGFPRERNPWHMAKDVFEKAMGPRWRAARENGASELPWENKP